MRRHGTCNRDYQIESRMWLDEKDCLSHSAAFNWLRFFCQTFRGTRTANSWNRVDRGCKKILYPSLIDPSMICKWSTLWRQVKSRPGIFRGTQGLMAIYECHISTGLNRCEARDWSDQSIGTVSNTRQTEYLSRI
jgi:hypothetical protein